MGPFVGFRTSRDGGQTWDEPRVRLRARDDTLFGEYAVTGSRAHKVKFGAPHVVDFGRNLAHTPDGKAYVVAHGSRRNTNGTRLTWMSGDDVYVARAAPDAATINDGGAWEFFGGQAGGQAVWVRGNVTAAQPVFSWLNRTGVVTMTYAAALQRYLTVVSTPSVYGGSTLEQYDTYVLESATPTGPDFALVAYLRAFGPEAYFVNIPTKFADPAVRPDGTWEFYLSYSANFACRDCGRPDPPDAAYAWVLQRARLRVNNN